MNTARNLRWVLMLTGMLSVAGASVPFARADFASQILVVRGAGATSALRSDAADALGQVGDIAPDEHYLAAARDQGVDPASDEALQTLAPEEYTTLIIVLARTPDGLHVGYFDGHTGTLLRSTDLPVAGKHLDGDAQALLAQGAQLAIEQLHGAAPPVASQRQAQAPNVVPVEAPPSAASVEAGEAVPPPATVEPEAAAPSDGTPAGLAVQIGAGLGFGEREASLPSPMGVHNLATGLFPAVDLLLAAEGALGEHWLFGARIRYQTSLFATASEAPPGGVYKDSSLRSHHVELGITPAYRFSNAKHAAALVLFAGWAFRGMRTVVDMSIPAYTLHGPVLRLELRLPFSDGGFTLRIAPEVIALASVSKDLRNAGEVQGSGVGFGGEVELRMQATDWLAVSASYRESHAMAPAWGASFTDVERFFTVQGVLQYY